MSLQDERAKVEAIEVTAKELLQLFNKIAEAGIPPHTDFWHQSIWEGEQKLKDAISAWNRSRLL